MEDLDSDMESTEKLLKKITEIIEVSGFHIILQGDPTVGIMDSEWNLFDDFYFDNQKELDKFKEELSIIFEGYCGAVTIETFNERELRVEQEELNLYQSYPVRYLIKDGSLFKMAGRTGIYGSDVGDAIHMELPKWMTVHYNDEQVIESTDPKFRKILIEAAGELEREIRNDEYSLKNAKRNLAAIETELKYGK